LSKNSLWKNIVHHRPNEACLMVLLDQKPHLNQFMNHSFVSVDVADSESGKKIIDKK